MATITVFVAASADDARNINGATSKSVTAQTQHIGKFNATDDYWNGFRWLNVTVPQGATITSATVDLYSAQTTAGTTAKSIWYGVKEVNTATFNTSTSYPEGKTRTTASVAKDFTASNWSSTLGYGVDPVTVTTLVQEIVNQASWASGNAMGIVCHDNGSSSTNYIGHSTYDRATDRGAKLTITYTTASTPTAPSGLAGTENSGAIDLTWTDNSTNETGFVLERKRGSGNYYQIATPAANATSYTDSDVDPGYTYTYRIKAVNGAEESAYNTSLAVAMSGTKAWTAYIQGWIFPDQADAQADLTDGRVMQSVKPEFGTIDTSGVYATLTGTTNSYDDPTMISNALAHSTSPYFTVSAGASGVAALVADNTLRTNAINGMLSVLSGSGFSGVELDWEGFGSWSSTTYTGYKTFVDDLVTAVHAVGGKVIICGPPIGDTTEQSFYQWKYEDFESSAVDFIEPLAYDWDFDYGAGTAIAPTTRVRNVCLWTRGKISDINRIIMGMPSYGYYGTTGGFTITNITKADAALRTGYPGTRDSGSEEMMFASGGVSTVYNDQTGMNTKREIIEDEGIKYISVWHLGDNDWFSGKAEITVAIPPNLFFF